MTPITYLLKKYKEIEDDYINRSPKEKWMFVRDIGQFILKITGVDFIDRNFKPTWYSYVPAIILIDLLISFFYTVWYYFGNETIKGFLMISMFGIVASGVSGYLLAMIPSNWKRLIELMLFAYEHNIYTDITDDTDPAYVRISEQSVNKLMRSLIQTFAIYGISGMMYGLLPIYHFITHQEIHLIAPVLLPFTNLTSVNGIVSNLVNQLFTTSIGICAVFGVEVGICMLKNTLCAIASAICYSINVMAIAFEESTQFSDRIVEIHFRNIVNQLRDYDRFLAEITDLAYWKFFIQSLTLNLSIALSWFFYSRGIWIPGLGVTIFSYAQLFVLCDTGTYISAANDMVEDALSEMPWYEMSVKNQLTYVNILVRLQNGTVFKVGPFAELNLVTFSTMTNKIYSFIMTLRKMLN